jgi:hypothetical protein
MKENIMKLGTQTASLVNHMMANTVTSEIKPGTGATFLSWTDRHPGTVINVFKKGAYTYLDVRHDRVEYHAEGKSTNDFGGTYDIVDGEDQFFSTFRFKTDGSSGFQKVSKNPDTGRWNKIGDGGLSVGTREYYYDPSF